MQVNVSRKESNSVSTIGEMSIDGNVVCKTLELAHGDVKVAGKTRIPAGNYTIRMRHVGESKFDPRYSYKFGPDWYQGMLEIMGIPGFADVLLHTGNSAKDTEGCILLGTTSNDTPDASGSFEIGASMEAFGVVYPQIRDAILRADSVSITVTDDDGDAAVA